ncbi:Fungal specific transcription factor [Elasticomyces elasticus]|nr:Fungal specific transcription factor [Elasticomyces elasticus]
MAAVMAAPQLAPRPIAAWTAPVPFVNMLETRDNRPALKQLQQSAPAARTRKERPCDGCRKRKSKCVLQDSRRCVLCEFHKQECTFVEKAQPRKRKLDDGTSTDGSGKKSPVVAQAIATSIPQQQLAVPPTVHTTNVAPVPVRKPFAVDESLSLQRHRHCKLLGHTTSLDASLISLGRFNDKNETQSRLGTLRQVNATEYFSTHDDADVAIPDDETRALAEIEQIVGQHGPALIDIYFRNVHPSYPIIQKNAFLDRHRHGDRQFNPPLLAAMYLLALSWWDTDPLSSAVKPDMARLEYIAISSLTIAMQRPKMSAVQAGLLLLQRAKSSTWTLTVQLVALAQDIGLHLDCTDWSIPPWERRLRKRLAWALYMQDKWSALMHGRPSHINAADWAVPAPTDLDFDESILPNTSTTTPDDPPTEALMAKGRTIFMQMITLTSIMADVCETFYSCTAKTEFQRSGRYATQLVLTRAKPVQVRLKDWFARLPPECKMDHHHHNPPSNPSPQSSTGYLHLGYFATEISIHRRIVQSLDPTTSDPYMLYICRSAAKTRLISAMDFVNRLTPSHLDAFWFFPSATNFALIGTFGALLQATSPGKEEAEFYASRLGEFKWSLRVSAKRAGWIAGALEMLEANGEMLAGLPEKAVISNGKGYAPPPFPPLSVMVVEKPKFVQQPFGQIDLGRDVLEDEEEDEEVDYGVGEVMEIDGWEGEYA